MELTRLRTLLVGHGRSAWWWGARWTVGVFAFGLSLWTLLWVLVALDLVLPLDLVWLVGAVGVASVVPAALFAYRHEGLLLCLALGSALPVVLYLVPAASPSMPPDESVLWALQAGLMFGVPAGAIGFLLGVGARLLVDAEP